MSKLLINGILFFITLSGVLTADPRCALPEEVWSNCGADSQKTCAEPNGTFSCPGNCIPGCVCREGLVRTGSRACIPQSECAPSSMNCPGPNEVLDRCQANGCQNTCLEPGRIASCDPLGCSFGCICLKGYLRNCQGICTWAEDCVKCGDANAHWSNSNATVCQDTCRKPDLTTYCTADPDAGCVCNEGFLKSDDGICLPAEECAFCDDPNAVYSLSDATGCQNTCEIPNLASICKPAGPRAGCICKEGFVKNQRGLCVRPCECGTSVCGVNEHYDQCAPTCPPDTCSTIGFIFFCPIEPPIDCKPACRCNLNYRRDGRDVCVPIADCPPLNCTGSNEIYDACPPSCDIENCIDLTTCTSTSCQEDPGVLVCRPTCKCIEGYYRKFVNNATICVPKEECFT